MTGLSPTILKYEPHAALRAGLRGLDFYPAIAEFSKNHLQENGFVAVEIGDTQALAVQNIFSKTGFSNIKIKRDYAGKDRVLWANGF
jgi:release factor glutamine methyltransferase